MGPPAVTMACLLLGFLLSTQPGADAQALELNTPFFSEVRVMTVKRYQAQAGQMQLTCRVSSPGRFKAWIKDNFVVGLDTVLTLSPSDPNKYGSYFCVADPEIAPNEYRALQFVITEMPPDERTTEVSATLNRDVSLTCQISSRSGSLRWYKYNDQNFKFEEISGQTGVQLVLSYPQLSREHGSGFTYYKCADPADASVSYQAFKVVKEPVQQMIDGRMTNVYEYGMRAVPTDVASVPISVTPKSKVAFECHKVTPSDSTQWYFRDNSTASADRYSDLSGQGGVEIQNNPDSSVLSVQNCDVKNKGYYRCVVGGTVKYAFLDIRVIVPTIHEYGKAIYDLARNPGADNELECEIPIGGELKDVIWRIVPSDGSTPVDIPVNRNSGGFETSIKDSGSSQLVTIKFRDNPRFNNYRLECRLGDELDYVTLRSAQPMRISVTVGPSRYPGISFVNCTSDPRLSDIKFHINNEKNDPINTPDNPHRQESETLRLYYHKTTRPNHWYRCSGVDPSTNTRKYSEPVPLVKDPLTLDIKIDGSLVSPKSGTPSMAKVVGQRTEFVCNFTNYKDLGIRPENVKLTFEGTVSSYRAVQLGPGTFRFVFDSPTRGNSGRYFCIHDVSNQGQRVRSSEVTINWCETNQFMCDNRCRDRSIVCNGVAECADRSDEHPALCSPCEPNEVPCQDWKGVRPARNCVLKHWLCDGTDDCENGYDEESPLSKEWCTNTCINKPWLNCPQNSTCCNSNDKCIVRAYECDSENDCATGEDETTCCSLALIEPTSRRLVEQREGSRVTLTCRAVGNERPTINWRCNWGKLREETRMKESNRVIRRNPDNTYEVEGTLVIENFTKTDECLYNCEAVTKCKRQLSPIFDVKVGSGIDCNKTCGIGGVCQNNVCNCKANVEGPNCDRCKRGYHSLRKDHPDGCVPCFCSDRSNACENAGLYFEEKQVTPIDTSSVRLIGWGLYGVYEDSTSHEKLSVESGSEIAVAPTGDDSMVLRDNDESYVFLTSLSGKRLAAYGGKVSFTVRVNVRMDMALRADTAFPIFGIKGWRGQTLVYWDSTTRRAPETRYSVTLDEQNLRAIDGSAVTRQDVMTALTDLRGVFFRVYQFQGQQNVRLLDIRYQEATARSGSDLAPVERCTLCPDPYQGAFCEDCKTTGDYHKIIDYNSTVNRWKCVPCKEGYQNSPACDKCEEGYADKILGRPSSDKPDCEEYVVPIVEPETLNVPSGRTVVLNCKIRNQKAGYNGTAWLLEWQDSQGRRLMDSPRVFQVRDEKSTRLVIKDASPADTGRYRCEGFNRRSGSAMAFSNLTVQSSSVKRVVLRSAPKDPDTTAIQCSVVAKEPSRPAQFRATLTRLPFPVGRQSERFENVRLQVNGANFTGTATYIMKNDNDTGYWSCHISDLINKITVSRQMPVILKPQQAFIWDLTTPVSKVEQPVGSAVRLKCNKIIRSPNEVSIPIVWTFKPANQRATSSFASPLGAPNQPSYSMMDETTADSLPPGVSRDGDDLVLNPLSVEHWGTFSCQRKPESTSSVTSSRSLSSARESYESKKASIEVTPQMAGTRNVNLNEGDSVTLSCLPTTKNLDDDGLPCHRYSWVYKSQKSAKQLLGRRVPPKMIQLFSETEPTMNITKAQHVNSGMYYCRCYTFYQPGRDAQFSKVMEYNVFISAVEEQPPSPKYLVAERTFINGKRQWFYCYDTEAIPTARVWWEVWDQNATTITGITLVDEGVIGNKSYSNITFIMDKHAHQLPFTCNAKNDVGHKTKVINMRYESTDYDPLQLKIIVKNTYDMMHKVQNDSHAVTDIVYAPMGQFGMADDGYKDPGVYIFCHMTGNPYGTELELVHNDPTSPSDVPDLIKQCNKMRVMANIVFCPLGKYEQYADFKWQCRAKQTNPETGAAVTYVKKLDFVKVPSKIKIRLQYYNKWYGYDERDLRFYMLRGGVALIRCDAGYYEGGRLSEIPFPHRYEFYIVGQDGLPHYASPAGNTLTLTDIPETLDNKEIVCFIRPQNNSAIATQGIGQRYFKVSVFTMPEKPNIIVTMKDSVDPSLIIRNPETVELRRNGPAVELTCTLQNYDATVDKTSGEDRYLDWVKCKNYKCLYAERIAGTTTEVSSMEKRLEGNKATLMVRTSSVMNSGIFMCVAVRPFIDVTSDRDYQMQSVPIKALVLTRPGEGDGSTKFGMMKITKTASGDLEFDCYFVGYPYPDLEITRHDMDNRDVRLENPKWIRQIEEAYYDDINSHRYGSQLIYKLPAENIGADKAKGTYVCTAVNSLGKAETERTWDGTITL